MDTPELFQAASARSDFRPVTQPDSWFIAAQERGSGRQRPGSSRRCPGFLTKLVCPVPRNHSEPDPFANIVFPKALAV